MTKGFKKLVEYEGKCQTCEHRDVLPDEEPCDECISNPVRDVSHTPINYKPKEAKK